jgi:hypothetical protein
LLPGYLDRSSSIRGNEEQLRSPATRVGIRLVGSGSGRGSPRFADKRRSPPRPPRPPRRPPRRGAARHDTALRGAGKGRRSRRRAALGYVAPRRVHAANITGAMPAPHGTCGDAGTRERTSDWSRIRSCARCRFRLRCLALNDPAKRRDLVYVVVRRVRGCRVRCDVKSEADQRVARELRERTEGRLIAGPRLRIRRSQVRFLPGAPFITRT